MFTGIIESTGLVYNITESGTNRTFVIESDLAKELKVDQSLAHNGVCLTVEKVENNRYQVTAVEETLKKTTMIHWKEGERINLERCLQWNGRIDGHIVQGHVDSIAVCTEIQEMRGSWQFRFNYSPKFAPLLIEKGSISLDGISLTVFDVTESNFTVAIIPYTFHHTNMQVLKTGKAVNIEFDMIGKYVNRILSIKANTK